MDEAERQRDCEQKNSEDQMLKLVAKRLLQTNSLLRCWPARGHQGRFAPARTIAGEGKRPDKDVGYYTRNLYAGVGGKRMGNGKQLAVQHGDASSAAKAGDKQGGRLAQKTGRARKLCNQRFQKNKSKLQEYFYFANARIFSIEYNNETVGIIGGENIDTTAGNWR